MESSAGRPLYLLACDTLTVHCPGSGSSCSWGSSFLYPVYSSILAPRTTPYTPCMLSKQMLREYLESHEMTALCVC
jgi:hypothetical protein